MPVNEGMANLSDVLFGVTIAVYALAMLAYAAEFAFNRLGRTSTSTRAARPSAADAARSPKAVGATGAGARGAQEASAGSSSDPGGSGGSGGGVAVLDRPADAAGADGSDGSAGEPPAPRLARWIGAAAVVLTVLGWAVHVGSAVTRGFAADRVPWGNMFEYSSMICLIAVTVFLALMTRRQVRWLGVFVMLPVVLTLGYAGTDLYVPAGPLVPALNSYWLKIHVATAILATGIFLVSGVLTVLFLIRDRWENRLTEVAAGRAEASRAMRNRGGIVMRLPSAATLDTLTYRTIAFAFPIWTFAIVAGAIWAEAAWGRYWGWDPKETWSFITWVIYAAYLHARATAGWRGRRAAAVSLFAFVALFIDYYLVNLVISGLHSYSGV